WALPATKSRSGPFAPATAGLASASAAMATMRPDLPMSKKTPLHVRTCRGERSDREGTLQALAPVRQVERAPLRHQIEREHRSGGARLSDRRRVPRRPLPPLVVERPPPCLQAAACVRRRRV